MSFLDKVRVSAGIGNAKVDTRVSETDVKQGGVVRGEVFLIGGVVEQQINAVNLSVMTTVIVESDDKKYEQNVEIQRVTVSEALTIAAKEEKVLPFSFTLSPETPLTVGRTPVWLKTALDVSFAVDPKDKDFINVRGTETVETILAAVQQLGFTVKKITNLKSRKTRSGVMQEFEFIPSGEFRRHFSELELVLLPNESGITVYLEMDHRAKGLGGLLAQAMDMDESRLSLHYRNGETGSVSKVAEEFRDVLLRNAR